MTRYSIIICVLVAFGAGSGCATPTEERQETDVGASEAALQTSSAATRMSREVSDIIGVANLVAGPLANLLQQPSGDQSGSPCYTFVRGDDAYKEWDLVLDECTGANGHVYSGTIHLDFENWGGMIEVVTSFEALTIDGIGHSGGIVIELNRHDGLVLQELDIAIAQEHGVTHVTASHVLVRADETSMTFVGTGTATYVHEDDTVIDFEFLLDEVRFEADVCVPTDGALTLAALAANKAVWVTLEFSSDETTLLVEARDYEGGPIETIVDRSLPNELVCNTILQ